MFTSILILFIIFKYIFSRCGNKDGSKEVYDNCYRNSLSSEEKNTKDELGYIPNDCCRLFFKEKDDICIPVNKEHIHEYFGYYNAVDYDSARCNEDKVVIYRNTQGPRCQTSDDCYKISSLSDADRKSNVLQEYEVNACCLFFFVQEKVFVDDEEYDIDRSYMCAPADKKHFREYFEFFYFDEYKEEGLTADYAECGDGKMYYFDKNNLINNKINIGLLILILLVLVN